jgi:hypothetical protein
VAWVLIVLSLEMGYFPQGFIHYAYDPGKYIQRDLKSGFYAQFDIEIFVFQYFFIRGSLNNKFDKLKEEIMFSPDHDIYLISLGAQYKGFEIGYAHKCYHPIFPFSPFYSTRDNIVLIEGTFDTLYMKVEMQLEIK